MGRVAIVTDSTADLPPRLRDNANVAMVPLVVNWENETFRDKVDLSTADFYRRLRVSKAMPKTGAPSMAAFEEAFRAGLSSGDSVVSVNLAGKLSATADVARKAAASVAPDRITVVDSGTVSICLAWLVETAARLAEEGKDAAAIVSTLEEMKQRMRIYVLVDTLEFLQRGGRIGRAQALVGGLLSVKPILSVQDGVVHPVERVRTLSGALRRLVELVVGVGRIERVGVVDGDAATSSAEVERQLQAHLPSLTIDRGELGPVTGTHAGPGVVGVGILLAR
jgi:DegV family protein with EDD domain